MCIRNHSESGQPCGFEPCEAYIKLLPEKSRLEGLCAGLEEGNKINIERIKKQDEQLVELLAENERLRQDRDRLAGVVEKADMLANHQMRECEACSNPCMAYGLARMYQEARHG